MSKEFFCFIFIVLIMFNKACVKIGGEGSIVIVERFVSTRQW